MTSCKASIQLLFRVLTTQANQHKVSTKIVLKTPCEKRDYAALWVLRPRLVAPILGDFLLFMFQQALISLLQFAID